MRKDTAAKGLIFAGGVIAGMAIVLASQAAFQDNGPAARQRTALDRDNVLILVNEQRLKAGLPQLSESGEIDKGAQEIAEKISSSGDCTHDFLRDERNAGDQSAASVGEDLVCGASDAETAVNSLMESPTHKDSLLNAAARNVGIGISNGNVVIHVK